MSHVSREQAQLAVPKPEKINNASGFLRLTVPNVIELPHTE